MNFTPGQIIRFSYQHESVDANTGDKFKEVLVLNPLYANKMHAIDLKRLSPAQRAVLEAVLDPEGANKPHRIPLVNDIRRRMDPIQLIRNPVAFYSRFLKPFLNRTDAYRQYIPKRMTSITVVKDATISTGKAPNKHPLFPPKPQTLPGYATTVKGLQTPGTPIDIMKQARAVRTAQTPRKPPVPPKLPSRGKVIRGKIERPK
ncbi:MAG: hypothetical protein A2139_14885 [Desulfobacca sp. RBG_16_60_12]|nr:MAG: hypothetical protein A2139_14885 [Desulfobacca sp. RBG_16_60_12]